jgi:chorismate lyase
VKIKPHNIKLRSNWLKKPVQAFAYRDWLVDERSLTARLQSFSTHFRVQAIAQQNTKPIADEAALLNCKQSTIANVRDVLLIGDEQVLVYAHSVLPHESLRGEWVKLGQLGNQPLGATLFANPRVKRSPLYYKKLAKHHKLYQKAAHYLPEVPAYLWARRSIFSLNGAHILVTEVFLPSVCER